MYSKKICIIKEINKMHWVIQDNLFKEKGYIEFVDALDKLSVNYTAVQVIPFSHEIIPEIINDKQLFPYGSTTLAKIGKDRNWAGAFSNNDFTFDSCLKNYGTQMLNHDAIVSEFKDAVVHDRMFIRPVEDSKSFSGMVISHEEFNVWKENISNRYKLSITSR